MWRKFCKFLLGILGWKAIEPPAPEDKCLILGVPHTSIWDFAISYLYYTSVGGKAYVLVKGEFFFWPLGSLLKKLGAIPLNKDHGVGVTKQIIDAFKNRDYLHLALAPEGTRAPVKKWKTGFHTIAQAANVPVYLGYFDWKKKIVGRGEKFELSDDANADMLRVQEHYKKMGVVGKHPDKFVYMV
ncbi:MAG: 1-acyl-sn-glycerol-3-phosphate acyltransferase [Bacteroidales bacterium]|mgnify:CR=1 FL=1|nr:1-acyl-sn-glycerol-3-phosphate acyltransferase [Bacteroidales bacterium]MDD4669630.1 1-acyl-sn-glycerol-3-phosphate acyltransferase [Bacteroidales bacterium]